MDTDFNFQLSEFQLFKNSCRCQFSGAHYRATGMAKQTIHDILEYFREAARNNRDLGGKFERLIAACLTKDPYYATHFSDVWLWME